MCSIFSCSQVLCNKAEISWTCTTCTQPHVVEAPVSSLDCQMVHAAWKWNFLEPQHLLTQSSKHQNIQTEELSTASLLNHLCHERQGEMELLSQTGTAWEHRTPKAGWTLMQTKGSGRNIWMKYREGLANNSIVGSSLPTLIWGSWIVSKQEFLTLLLQFCWKLEIVSE